ncbi:MAG: hypothetical protein ACOZCO_16730 [Bacteroidota bacterium]
MEDNYVIQQLIETKPFELLSEEERTMVLVYITENEYTSRRILLESTRLFLQSETESSDDGSGMRKSIVALMKAKKQQGETPLQKIILFRVPGIAAVAAVLLIIFLLPLFYGEESNRSVVKNEPEMITQTVYKTDTITVEKEVIKNVNIPVIKYVEVVKEVQPSVPGDINTAGEWENRNVKMMNDSSFSISKAQLEMQKNNTGRPTSAQPELNKFLVVAQ